MNAKKDVGYSDFRNDRQLFGLDLFCWDIDMIEVRSNGQIVGLFETTVLKRDFDNGNNQKVYLEALFIKQKYKIQLLKTLSGKLGLNAYYVLHTEDMTTFYVINLSQYDTPRVPYKYNQREYISFIRNL